MMDLKNLETSIENIGKEHDEIIVIYLFGSLVKGLLQKDSDIDIGLLLKENFTPDRFYATKIAGKIKELSNIDHEIDVRILNNQSYRFLHQVIRDSIIIFCRDETERIKFETTTIKKYFDLKPFYEEYDQKRRERILGLHT